MEELINQAEEITSKLLSFLDNPIQELTLEQLKLTADERTTGQNYMNGIAHHQIFDRVSEIMDKHNLKFYVDKIYAADNKNKSLPGVTVLPLAQEKYGMNSLESHILRRINGKLNILTDNDATSCGSIALSFHQQGIQLAFGQNVHICSNMSIFGENLIYSYGQNGMPIDKMFNVIGDWANQYGELRAHDVSILKKMNDIFIEPSKAIPELIGKLQIEAVNAAYRRSNIVPPLNIGQISAFTKSILDKTDELSSDTFISVYELYNFGTEMHKVGETDLPNILPANKNFGNFFIRNYEL
jgi:hypothetical protein